MIILKKRKNSGKSPSFAKSILMGIGVGIIVWVMLLTGTSALICGFDEPENFVTPASLVMIAVSAFTSGAVSSKLAGKSGLFAGLISGGALLMMVWAISLAISNDVTAVSLPLKLIIAFNFLFFAFLGTFAGRPSTKIKRRVRR